MHPVVQERLTPWLHHCSCYCIWCEFNLNTRNSLGWPMASGGSLRWSRWACSYSSISESQRPAELWRRWSCANYCLVHNRGGDPSSVCHTPSIDYKVFPADNSRAQQRYLPVSATDCTELSQTPWLQQFMLFGIELYSLCAMDRQRGVRRATSFKVRTRSNMSTAVSSAGRSGWL